MTAEEAIGKIRRLKKECRAIAFQWDWYEDCLDMAIDALEKQIQKKPDDVITSDNEYIGSVCDCGYFLGIQREYCPNCGQRLKIDWSDEE